MQIHFTKKSNAHMKNVDFIPQTGNLGQSILKTPTESSYMPLKLSSLDGSLIDQKMGAAPLMKARKEEATESDQGDIQIINRFNDH
jgi:hypothetical protein